MKEGGVSRQDILLAPSVCCNLSPGGWSIEDVLNGGLLTNYGDSVSQLAVQRYPRGQYFIFHRDGAIEYPLILSSNTANCDGSIQAEVVFPDYLLHGKIVETLSGEDYATAAGTWISGSPLLFASPLSDYLSAVAVAQNKPLVMFETNTASCSGFPGISDSFAATLWAVGEYDCQLFGPIQGV